MARPSASEIETESNLMLAHGDVQRAIDSIGTAASTLRQIYHRWPATKPYLDRIDTLLGEAIDCATDAQIHLQTQIDDGQMRRRARNAGKCKGILEEQ